MKKLLIVSLLLGWITLKGQNLSPNLNDSPFIEVVGVAEKEIVPDEIYISIVIKEHNEGKENVTIEQQEITLKAALTDIGIPLENLYLSDANSNYLKVRLGKKEVIAKTEYILKVTDAFTVGKVFEKLDILNIQDACIQKVSHSKLQEYKKEIRILAIKAAKEKADYLLSAIGEKTGNALKINELNQSSNPYEVYANVVDGPSKLQSFSSSDSGFENQTIQFRKMKIQTSIYVKFSIIQ